MKYNPIVFLGKLFDNKKFLIAFSVVCAVIFWLVIDISENPTREITFSDISVAVSDQKDDGGNVLTPMGEYNNKVSVTVSGPGYIITNITKKDISVSVVSYADVNKPGTYVLNLTAKVDDAECNVVKISPSYIKLDYDYETTAEIPVEVDITEFQNALQSEYEIYKTNLKSNANGNEIPNLSITGPSEIVNSITKVVVTPVINTEILPKSQNFKTTLVFYDASDNPVDSSFLIYDTDTYVRVVVYRVAEVDLKPTFTNLPLCYSSSQSGLPPLSMYRYEETARAKTEIAKVKIRGPVEIMDELIAKGMRLTPIDFSKVIKGNTSFNVSFEQIDGVEIIDGTEEVTVALQLGTLETKTITLPASRIQCVGLPDGLTGHSTITGKDIRVTVCFDRSKTSRTKIVADNFVLKVDCSGITSASSVKKTISASAKANDIYAWAISVEPVETTIEIK